MGLLWLALDQVMGCCLPSHRNSPSPVPVVRTDSRPSLSPRMEEISVYRTSTFLTPTCSPVLPST